MSAALRAFAPCVLRALAKKHSTAAIGIARARHCHHHRGGVLDAYLDCLALNIDHPPPPLPSLSFVPLRLSPQARHTTTHTTSEATYKRRSSH